MQNSQCVIATLAVFPRNMDLNQIQRIPLEVAVPAMKKYRITETEIAYAAKQAEAIDMVGNADRVVRG